MMLAVIPISFFGAYLGFMVTAQFIGLERENLLLLLVGGLVGMFAAGIGFVLIGGRLIPKETVWVRASVA